jgi:hypothetical protein
MSWWEHKQYVIEREQYGIGYMCGETVVSGKRKWLT